MRLIQCVENRGWKMTYLGTLKRVGVVLVLVGLVDIAYMVYCISRDQGYSSGLNIFVVIAGVFLWRGHLGAARIVAGFAAFFLATTIGMLRRSAIGHGDRHRPPARHGDHLSLHIERGCGGESHGDGPGPVRRSVQVFPAAIHWAGHQVTANVTAYNDHEIKVVAVEWQQ